MLDRKRHNCCEQNRVSGCVKDAQIWLVGQVAVSDAEPMADLSFSFLSVRLRASFRYLVAAKDDVVPGPLPILRVFAAWISPCSSWAEYEVNLPNSDCTFEQWDG